MGCYQGLEALRGAKPWFVMAAITQLEDELIQPNWRAFEWGCGGSTLWLSQWCDSVVSLEHDREWHKQVSNDLVTYNISNVELICADLGGPYETYIDHYEVFDLIFIDGRNRVACLGHAVRHLSPGGVLVLDNSEREQYQVAIIEHLASWERWDHLSQGGGYAGWTTSIWQKPR